VTPDELHHPFRRWAGLTPKAFMQALTLDHAKGLLRDSASVLDAALDSGLSGPGRLHDLFVTHEAMSPGEWKNGGAGMTLRYGFHACPFGTAIVIASERGLAGLAFADPGEEPDGIADMKRRSPNATYVEDHDGTAGLAQRIFDTRLWRPDQPLRVVLIGTDFEVRVWETLLKIPMGRAVCYSISPTRSRTRRPHAPSAPRRPQPGVVRGALPSRARQGRRADRLSLGHHAQAGDARLGSGAGGIALTRRVGKGASPCPPLTRSMTEDGGHASLCPPYD
jgi:O6-methylguanine-DNA--protein-cysteine methyltransferase